MTEVEMLKQVIRRLRTVLNLAKVLVGTLSAMPADAEARLQRREAYERIVKILDETKEI